MVGTSVPRNFLVPPPATAGILRELARLHSITFFSFHATHENDAHPDLKNMFDRVVCVPLSLPASKSRMLIPWAWERADECHSRACRRKYCRSEVRQKLRALLQREMCDVMLCDFMSPAGIIPWDYPWVLKNSTSGKWPEKL